MGPSGRAFNSPISSTQNFWFVWIKKHKSVVFGNVSIFLGSVDRRIFSFWKLFFYRKSMKIIQNTLKMEEKFSDVPKNLD